MNNFKLIYSMYKIVFIVNYINGDYMNENLELLNYIYKSSDMGVISLTNILKEINYKENKIKSAISTELSIYEKYNKKCKELLKKNKTKLDGNSLITKVMSKQGIKMEVDKDNSDSAIAHMIIEGLTMGVVDMESHIKNMSDKVDKKILNIASDYLKFHQDEIEKMKNYL